MERKPNVHLPRTLGQLRAWLRDTTIGQRLLRELAKEALEEACRECQYPIRAPKVLAVVRRLGPLPGVEVYAERGVRVRLEELVDTRDDPVQERLADELLEAQLPKAWKRLVNCRRWSMPFRGLTAGERLVFLDDLGVIRALET